MSGKKALIMAVLLVAVVALMAGCTGQTKTAKTGDNVTVDYVGWVRQRTSIIDTSIATVAQGGRHLRRKHRCHGGYEPLSIVIGNGDVIPGFENAIIGMKVGETKNVTISPADAYGDYDPAYIQPVNMSDLLDADITPYVNQTLYSTMYGQSPGGPDRREPERLQQQHGLHRLQPPAGRQDDTLPDHDASMRDAAATSGRFADPVNGQGDHRALLRALLLFISPVIYKLVSYRFLFSSTDDTDRLVAGTPG